MLYNINKKLEAGRDYSSRFFTLTILYYFLQVCKEAPERM